MLGRMSVTMHEGLLQAAVSEGDAHVLAAALRLLAALAASVPYHRLPEDLPHRALQACSLAVQLEASLQFN